MLKYVCTKGGTMPVKFDCGVTTVLRSPVWYVVARNPKRPNGRDMILAKRMADKGEFAKMEDVLEAAGFELADISRGEWGDDDWRRFARRAGKTIDLAQRGNVFTGYSNEPAGQTINIFKPSLWSQFWSLIRL